MGQRSKEVGPGLNRVDHDGRAGRKRPEISTGRFRLDGQTEPGLHKGPYNRDFALSRKL